MLPVPPPHSSRWRERCATTVPIVDPPGQQDATFSKLISALNAEFNFAQALIKDLHAENSALRAGVTKDRELVKERSPPQSMRVTFAQSNGHCATQANGHGASGQAGAGSMAAAPTANAVFPADIKTWNSPILVLPELPASSVGAPQPGEWQATVVAPWDDHQVCDLPVEPTVGMPDLPLSTTGRRKLDSERGNGWLVKGDLDRVTDAAGGSRALGPKSFQAHRPAPISVPLTLPGTSKEDLHAVDDKSNLMASPSSKKYDASPHSGSVGLSPCSPLARSQARHHTGMSITSAVSQLSLLGLWKEPSKSRRLKRLSQVSTTTNASQRSRVTEGENESSDGEGDYSNSKGPAVSTNPEHYVILRSGDELVENSFLQRFVLNPRSKRCLTWDLITFFIMVFDLIMIPLQVYDMSGGGFLAMDWVTALLWTFDIFACFLRGVDIGGVIDMRPSRIARWYISTWFGLDFTVVTLDWVLIFEATSSDVSLLEGFRMRRLIRILRGIRLLRIAKLAQKENMKRMVTSEHYVAVLSIVKLLVLIWVVNHYISCGWYAIGTVGYEPNWVDVNFDPEHSQAYKYFSAFHWSMTQFTPASMEIVPENTLERIYTIFAIFFGLVMFSSFVSHMTNAVKNFQELTAKTEKQRSDLRRYISDHKVSFNLSNAITGFVKTSANRKGGKRLLSSEIPAFRILPDNLLNRLHVEVHAPIISNHPFFRKIKDAEKACFLSICKCAVGEKNVLVGEELFRYGAQATRMYFTTSGRLAYFQGIHDMNPVDVEDGTWFSELTLWSKWEHKGRMVSADQVAEVVYLEASEFHTIISSTSSMAEVQRYAKLYCLRAANECGGKDEITDLWGSSAQIAGTVRQAWSSAVGGDVVNKVAMLLWQGTEDMWMDAWDAWKRYAKEEVACRNQRRKQRLLSWVFPSRRQPNQKLVDHVRDAHVVDSA